MSHLPLPPLAAVLLQSRRDALGAFLSLGWIPWSNPPGLDAERRRSLNVDLTAPEVSFGNGPELTGVANVETDREGLVSHVEVVSSDPAEPSRVALALFGSDPGEPRTGGGTAAREWIWGPESGATATIGGEAVRLWVCAEQAYGDRLWLVASLVRRAGADD